MLHDVDAMLTLDALFEWVRIVVIVFLHLIDEVVGGTVASDGVGGGYDADVLNLWCMWVSVAVTVDGDVVEHIDIDDVTLAEVVGNSLCSGSHTFKEGILRLGVLPSVGQFAGHAVGVDVPFACRRSERVL